MTPDDFVELFANTVYRAAIRDVRSALLDPPGRRPAPELVTTSKWYRGLSQADRAAADIVIAHAAHASAFGVLALLDGVRAADDVRFELVAIEADGDRTSINPTDGALLHDRFQARAMRSDGTLIR